MDIDIIRFYDSIKDSPFIANLNAALESKTNIALILGFVDDTKELREMYGLVSCDDALQAIGSMLHYRFGDWSFNAYGWLYLVLVTGEQATNAREIAESIRVEVEKHEGLVVPSLKAEPIDVLPLAERVHITMHFGVTQASSHWTSVNGFAELLKAAQKSIEEGRRKLVANRVYV